MRQIDNMNSQEIDTLKLKGMLPEKTNMDHPLKKYFTCDEARRADAEARRHPTTEELLAREAASARKRRTPIPLLGLQIALFNAYPCRTHKDAVAALRARTADLCYGTSYPVRERR